MIRYAKLNLKTDIYALKAETERIKTSACWLPHFNNYHYDGNWEVFALRSPGGINNSIIPELRNESEFKNTSLMRYFPSVKKIIKEMKCSVMSVRLLNLKAGAIIKPHRDYDLCFESGEARIHFPIFTNPDVQFFVNDDLLEMKEGECWYINANRMHHVLNKGLTDRIHLVIDCEVNAWLKNIFNYSEIKLVSEKERNDEKEKIIKELRLQNNETSNKLANDISDGKIKI
jgi:mannose-6-phosphate isomerase-like protein (cupin superfamily)